MSFSPRSTWGVEDSHGTMYNGAGSHATRLILGFWSYLQEEGGDGANTGESTADLEAAGSTSELRRLDASAGWLGSSGARGNWGSWVALDGAGGLAGWVGSSRGWVWGRCCWSNFARSRWGVLRTARCGHGLGDGDDSAGVWNCGLDEFVEERLRIY